MQKKHDCWRCTYESQLTSDGLTYKGLSLNLANESMILENQTIETN